jgi:hypothetical protein
MVYPEGEAPFVPNEGNKGEIVDDFFRSIYMWSLQLHEGHNLAMICLQGCQVGYHL